MGQRPPLRVDRQKPQTRRLALGHLLRRPAHIHHHRLPYANLRRTGRSPTHAPPPITVQPRKTRVGLGSIHLQSRRTHPRYAPQTHRHSHPPKRTPARGQSSRPFRCRNRTPIRHTHRNGGVQLRRSPRHRYDTPRLYPIHQKFPTLRLHVDGPHHGLRQSLRGRARLPLLPIRHGVDRTPTNRLHHQAIPLHIRHGVGLHSMRPTTQRAAHLLRRKRPPMVATQLRQSPYRRNGRPAMGTHQLQQLDIRPVDGPTQPRRVGETYALLRHHQPTPRRHLAMPRTLRSVGQRDGHSL